MTLMNVPLLTTEAQRSNSLEHALVRRSEGARQDYLINNRRAEEQQARNMR